MAVRRSSFLFVRPSYIIRSRAMTQGVFGGHRGWQVVAAIVFGRQILKRVLGKNPELLAQDVLHAGESLTIRTMAPPERGRKARRKAS
jgi:hypothetical protein